METGPDFVVSELLSELKAENTRKDKQVTYLVRLIKIVLVSSLVAVLLTVVGFLWYLNQYDYVDSTIQTAEGFYAIVDSSGNVVGQDLTEDQIDQILRGDNSG